MSIDFNGIDKDFVTVEPNPAVMTPDDTMRTAQTMMRATMIGGSSNSRPFVNARPDTVAMTQAATIPVVTGNGAKPDLNPSVGVALNPVPQLSVVLYGQLRIPDFDTAAGAFQVPVTLRVEASPNQKFDFGLEFTLLNLLPPDPQSPIDNRFLNLFVQARFGK